MWNLFLHDAYIKNLEVGVNPFVADEILSAVWTVQNRMDKLESHVMLSMDVVQALYLIDIRANLAQLKEVAKVLAETGVAPHPLPLIPLFASLVLDRDSLVPGFYTLALNIMDIGGEDMGTYLEPHKKEQG